MSILDTCCSNHRGSRFANLADFCDAHPQYKEKWVAEQVGIDPSRFSKLKTRKYGLRPTPAEIAAIAGLLKRKESYVSELYSAQAA